MSIFKAREWWSTKVDGGEELDGACMAVGNIDNEADGSDKIVLGGFSGTVRIYKPTARGFKPNNIKCEQHLGAPILQVRTNSRVLPGWFLAPGRLGLPVAPPGVQRTRRLVAPRGVRTDES